MLMPSKVFLAIIILFYELLSQNYKSFLKSQNNYGSFL